MLRLRTFGGLSIEGRFPLSGSGTQRRPLAVLAVLAVAAPRAVSRDRIVALLWPESDAEHARNSLSQVLSSLRRDLSADDVVIGSGELRLNSDCLASDVADFEQRLAAGDFETATTIYTGDGTSLYVQRPLVPTLFQVGTTAAVPDQQWDPPFRFADCTIQKVRRPVAFVCVAFDFVSDVWEIENFDPERSRH